MKQCSLFCAGLWPFVLLPLLLLLPLLFFKWHVIEEDVAKNARADLATIGADWAKIETRNLGRDVLITGTPPNQAAIDSVEQQVQGTYGVNRVVISTDVKALVIPPKMPELKAIISGDSVVLKGSLADQASLDRILMGAEQAFGADKVINKLNVAANTAKFPALSGFFLALVNKSSRLRTLTAHLVGNKLKLSGSINSAESNSALETQMEQQLQLKVDNQLSIITLPVKQNICIDLVNNLMKKGRINFSTGNATIEKSSFALLEEIKTATLPCTGVNFEVSGHTDSIGSLSFNTRLSLQRAQAVVNHLVAVGSDANRFTATGYGPTQAIADNSTAEGRSKNRRIEFKLKN